MPYAHIRKRIPRNLDRRVKYTTADKERVVALFKSGFPQRAIARETGISRRMVSFILFPDRLARQKELYKERRKDGRYYYKDTWAKTMKEHRHYKESIKNELV
jgi:hypothetical protein